MVSNYLCLFGLLWALLSPALAGAQVTFYVTAESDRAFVIEADDIDAGSAVELTVVYDSQSLANPKASLTQGTLTDMVDAAGTLVLSAVQGEDSTATFGLHLKFDKAEGRPGGIFSVRGTITGPDGAAASSRTLPGASSPEVLQSFSGACEPAPEDAEGPPEILSPGQNVLQRFRNFQGKRGVKAFAALFRRSPSDGMVQDPPVVLSDGKEPVRIHFASGEGADPPDVALSDAKLLSLAREGDQGWVLTALPNEGTWDASLIAKVNERLLEFPLVVAPPLITSQAWNERNFLPELDRLLLERCAAGRKENSAQLRAFWEYVFTANYLAHLEAAPSPVVPGGEPKH